MWNNWVIAESDKYFQTISCTIIIQNESFKRFVSPSQRRFNDHTCQQSLGQSQNMCWTTRLHSKHLNTVRYSDYLWPIIWRGQLFLWSGFPILVVSLLSSLLKREKSLQFSPFNTPSTTMVFRYSLMVHLRPWKHVTNPEPRRVIADLLLVGKSVFA